MALEAGGKFQDSLQEVLSHQQFFTETLEPVVLEKLQEDASEALREAEAHRTSLKESIEVFYIDVTLLNGLNEVILFLFNPRTLRRAVKMLLRTTQRRCQ